MAIRRRSKPRVERQWKQITNEVPFNAKFSEDIMAELYEAEDARAQMFAAFSLLAVVIGCLGLFGLAAFTAERRTKEIGIRKVLGARTRDIVRLLVWQFSRPVIVANLIAWPVAWWLMRDWLNQFDDRITLGPGAVRRRRADRADDRHRHGRRPRVQGGPGQPDPRAPLRMTTARALLVAAAAMLAAGCGAPGFPEPRAPLTASAVHAGKGCPKRQAAALTAPSSQFSAALMP